MATRLEYRTEARSLLRDPNADTWDDATINPFINDAIKKRDRITGCNRELQTLSVAAGDEQIAFADLTNPRVFDVVGVYVLFSGSRYRLVPMSFSALNVWARRMATAQRGLSGAWAKYGQTGLYIAPAPGTTTTFEFDCCVYSADMDDDTDDDGIEYPFTEPVKYYVAHLAKLNQLRYEQAEAYRERFMEECRQTTQAVTGFVPGVPR